jgi:hypothetical protein
MTKITLILLSLLLSSCILKNESPLESSSSEGNLIQSGDIVVTNAGNDTIVLLHEDGSYKDTLVDSQSDTQLIFNGLAYDAIHKNILFTYDHLTAVYDAVKTIDLYDGAVNTLITNNNLQGTLPGLARLTGGDLVVLEGTNTAEKFLANGTRSGTPFLATLTTNVADITRLSNGGFVTCSSGTANTVRTYNAAGVVQATATSASPTPTLGALAATSCTQNSAGNIIVAYSGATDAVRMYNSSLSTVIWTFTDTNVLTTPGKISLRQNGNILITDTGFHHIVEIDPNGALVRVIGGAVLSTPNNIVVIP